MSIVLLLVIVAAAIALGLGLAYVPMRLLMFAMARNVREFIQRQRDRRQLARTTPDRRKI